MTGACLGSFTSAYLYRLPKKISVSFSQRQVVRSFCPACKTTLRWVDLIPVFSWIVRRGRCGYCSHKIALRYFMIECFFGILSFLAFLKWSISVELVFFIVLSIFWVSFSVLAMTEKKYFSQPCYAAFGGGLIYAAAFSQDFLPVLINMAALSAIVLLLNSFTKHKQGEKYLVFIYALSFTAWIPTDDILKFLLLCAMAIIVLCKCGQRTVFEILPAAFFSAFVFLLFICPYC